MQALVGVASEEGIFVWSPTVQVNGSDAATATSSESKPMPATTPYEIKFTVADGAPLDDDFVELSTPRARALSLAGLDALMLTYCLKMTPLWKTKKRKSPSWMENSETWCVSLVCAPMTRVMRQCTSLCVAPARSPLSPTLYVESEETVSPH